MAVIREIWDGVITTTPPKLQTGARIWIWRRPYPHVPDKWMPGQVSHWNGIARLYYVIPNDRSLSPGFIADTHIARRVEGHPPPPDLITQPAPGDAS